MEMPGYTDFKQDFGTVLAAFIAHKQLFPEDQRFRALVPTPVSVPRENLLTRFKALRDSFDIRAAASFFGGLHELFERLDKLPDSIVAKLAEPLYSLGWYAGEVHFGTTIYPEPSRVFRCLEFDLRNPAVLESLAESAARARRDVVCCGMIPRLRHDSTEAYVRGMDLHMTSSSLWLATKSVMDCVQRTLERTQEGRDVLSRGKPIPPRERPKPASGQRACLKT